MQFSDEISEWLSHRHVLCNELCCLEKVICKYKYKQKYIYMINITERYFF